MGRLGFGGVGGRDGSGLDPVFDGADVGVGEVGAGAGGHGHGVVGWAFVADEADQEALAGVSGDDGWAAVAAFKEAGLGFHAEAAAVVHAAVATEAVGFEDGADAGGVELGGGGVFVGLDGLGRVGGDEGGGEGEGGGAG